MKIALSTLTCLVGGLCATATALAQGRPEPPPAPAAGAPAPPPGPAPAPPPGPATAPPPGPGQPPPVLPGVPPSPGQPQLHGQPPPYGQPQQPYAQPQPYGPPPGAVWPPPGYAASQQELPPASAPAAEEPAEGVTGTGLPLDERGGFLLDASAMKGTSYAAIASTALTLAARVPVSERTFLDARLPLAYGVAGNPTVGVHHVSRLGQSTWLSAGGAFGVPLAPSTDRTFSALAAARSYWDIHEFFPDVVPVIGRLGLEAHADAFIVRCEFEPMVLLDSDDGTQFVVQQAAEVQLGHRLGGGVRLQGVWLASFEDDVFQATLEPFLALEQERLFLRAGLLLPLDEDLGPPFEDHWGFRLATGFRIE
jgi:hypothetical protein